MSILVSIFGKSTAPMHDFARSTPPGELTPSVQVIHRWVTKPPVGQQTTLPPVQMSTTDPPRLQFVLSATPNTLPDPKL